MECCTIHDSLNFFRRMLLNEGPRGFEFFWGGLPEKRAQFFLVGCDLRRNYGMAVILLSLLCNYDNLTLKLHQEKWSYPDEEWIFIGRFKVGSVPRTSIAREAKSITHSWSPRKFYSLKLFILKKDVSWVKLEYFWPIANIMKHAVY